MSSCFVGCQAVESGGNIFEDQSGKPEEWRRDGCDDELKNRLEQTYTDLNKFNIVTACFHFLSYTMRHFWPCRFFGGWQLRRLRRDYFLPKQQHLLSPTDNIAKQTHGLVAAFSVIEFHI